MPRYYKCLSDSEYSQGIYTLGSIRDEDKNLIMQWRNEQIDILRQKEVLTPQMQEWYFTNIVDKLFEQEKPNQLLFSFFENKECIGYGGLVHIDWESRNAELSFLTSPERAVSTFATDWSFFLNLIKRVAYLELDFFKIYTYAYDIRPQLYEILKKNGFVEEARLKNHISINNKFYDVLIHSFFFEVIYFRMATKNDVQLYFKWVNDREVRSNSFQNDPVKYEDHSKWFFSKLDAGNCFFYIFYNDANEAVGQVRIEITSNETIIGISVDKSYRGKSLSSKMLLLSTNDFLKNHHVGIVAYIKETNVASYRAFISAGFREYSFVLNDNNRCYKLLKKHE